MMVLAAMLAVPGMSLRADDSVSLCQEETKAQRDERMAWWREARFGMFIHWGVYAVPAGVHKGELWGGVGEWIMLTKRIRVADYRAYAKEFNPVKYDPSVWAKLAKQAGMRYIVITSKHHDGFALFPSAVTDLDVADATPYGKDLIEPLARATRTEGLKFGLYYSQAQDWVNPGGAKATDHGFKEGGGWDPAHLGSFDDYLNQIAVPQVAEVLSRYQPDILWWDTDMWMNKERAERFLPLLKTRPGIITNNRLGGGYKGDTETPEQHIPATGYKDRDWEVCMTMNDTWGYKTHDHNWKSTKDLVHKLCDIVSKGGNFLLNVGPTAEGEIPQPSIDRLLEVGAWMNVNGESIYGTTASPFDSQLVWGRCTKKVRENGTTLYFHVFDWPDNGKLVVPGLKNKPASVRLLQTGEPLEANVLPDDEGGVVIDLPEQAPDSIATVIKVEIDGDLCIEPTLPKQDENGQIELLPTAAELHHVPFSQLQLVSKKGGIRSIWAKLRCGP